MFASRITRALRCNLPKSPSSCWIYTNWNSGVAWGRRKSSGSSSDRLAKREQALRQRLADATKWEEVVSLHDDLDRLHPAVRDACQRDVSDRLRSILSGRSSSPSDLIGAVSVASRRLLPDVAQCVNARLDDLPPDTVSDLLMQFAKKQQPGLEKTVKRLAYSAAKQAHRMEKTSLVKACYGTHLAGLDPTYLLKIADVALRSRLSQLDVECLHWLTVTVARCPSFLKKIKEDADEDETTSRVHPMVRALHAEFEKRVNDFSAHDLADMIFRFGFLKVSASAFCG